ncbi:CAP domain-containing protein [Meiothermus rufus]|uniref:CAP domain-containing protein n=1 Tax=Meiothermus rufus TaxID=604332 RepID=UPI00041DB818|nr:CAP domain-containing protein [Meiothermus rufus]
MPRFLLIGLAPLAACSSPTRVEYNPPERNEAVAAVNTARGQRQTCNGTPHDPVSPLHWNGLLGEVARQRAEHIQQTGEFSHDEGATPNAFAVRAQNNGYRYREIRENLAQGYPTVQAAVQAWLASTSGHCETLMAAHLQDMGMVQRGAYWVLVVAQPY